MRSFLNQKLPLLHKAFEQRGVPFSYIHRDVISEGRVKVPVEFESIIADVEKRQEPLPSHYFQTELTKARAALGKNLDADLNAGAFAELVAWSLTTEAWGLEPWHSYFGPFGSWINVDGRKAFAPAVDQVDEAIFWHWASRIGQFRHPALEARYADLCWDLARTVGNAKPDFRHAVAAVDAYLEGVSSGLVTEFHEQIASASRALDIARQIRDNERSEAAIVMLLELHDKAVAGEGWWWKTYDRLIADRALTDDRRAHLAQSLEGLAANYADTANPEKFDPFQLESVSERLQAYYNRVGSRPDVVRLHETVGRAFEHTADLGDNLRASSMLQSAENAYLDAGKPEDAKRARIARIKAIEASREEMQSFETTQTITKEEMEAFISTVVTDNPLHTFARIANQFVPEVAQIEAQIKKGGEEGEASIMDFIPIAIMAKDHQAAMLGGVEDDLDGRVIHQAQQNVQWTSPYLHRALQAAIEKHELNPYAVTGFAERSGLFEDSSFILEGVSAWFAHDHMKAIHVLVPQVERALRTITGKLGEPVTRKHPTMLHREIAIGMGEMFGNKVVKETLGVDLTLYFKLIYSDPRGLNLRNSIAHGTLERGMVNAVISDLLIHSLLVLGLWYQLSDHRKRKVAGS
jgi:lysyl-tRNA synthetase class 1